MNHQAYSKAENYKLQYIDNLRGIAILMVIVNHSGKYISGLNTSLETFAGYCQMGVQLFFIVSAFTLCLSMDSRSKSGEPVKAFYIRRYFRIAPLYYFGILLYCLYFSVIEPVNVGVSPALAEQYNVSNVLANIFLIHDFVPGPANNRVVPGGWSIGTETTFYVIFPFLFIIYSRFRKNNLVLTLLPFVGFVICFLFLLNIEFLATEVFNYDNFWFFEQNNSFIYFNIICQLPVFLLGMSLYFKSMNFKKTTVIDKYLLSLVFLAFTFIAVTSFLYFNSEIYLLPFAPALSFFFLFLLFKEVPFLSNPVLGRIGQLSFSIYLFHFVFAWEGSRWLFKFLNGFVDPNVIFLINILLTITLSVVVALFSEKYIEKPGMELGKKLIRGIKKKNAPEEYAIVSTPAK